MDTQFDYVIVGAGAAGAILANRLTKDPRTSVLLLEAGGGNPSVITSIPKAFFFTAYDPRTSRYFTKSFPTDRETWTRGRMLGGSTEINGMVWNRGWREDYDAIEAAGNPGWGWSDFVRAFKALEDHELGESDVRGEGGPVKVSRAFPGDLTTERFFEAANSHGLATVEDLNGSDQERVGYTSSTIHKGRRWGADAAFLRPIRRRKNLTIVTHANVSNIVLEGGRATAVRANVKGTYRHFNARKEVLLAAGAMDTPGILERSGIGDPDVLTAAGVDVRVVSPKVGENLSEHRGLTLMYDTTGTPSYNEQLNSSIRQGLTGLKYLFTRTGVMSFGGYNALAHFKSDPSQSRPDVFGMFTPISIDRTKSAPTPNQAPGLMLLLFPVRPASRGSVHIVSKNPDDLPRTITGFLEADEDRRALIGGLRRGREILRTMPLGQHLLREVAPSDAVTSDEAIVKMSLEHGAAGYHTLGTTAMGPEEDDVVDAQLRVRGVAGLRVVDASIFPHLTAGNNAAATMAGAWLAADIILSEG